MSDNIYSTEFVDELNKFCKDYSAIDLVHWATTGKLFSETVFTTSFGTSSVVLLHLLSLTNRNTPVIFLDTKKHFPETLKYRDTLINELGLTNIRTLSPCSRQIKKHDRAENLYRLNPDACCNLRKTEVLKKGLSEFSTCVTGRAQFQSETRKNLNLFEYDNEFQILKINPLAYWSKEDFQSYVAKNNLPNHPLEVEGFMSIGCAPCSEKVNPTEHPRSGRWRGRGKKECGLHISSKKNHENLKKSHLIITDTGFETHNHNISFVDINAASAPQDISTLLNKPRIRINFSNFADGRGLTYARLLRLKGFNGILRAKGDLLPDQYSMLRRSGFDELEIDPATVERHSKTAWLSQINWRDHHYQQQLGLSLNWTYS